MCAVIGAVVGALDTEAKRKFANKLLNYIFVASHDRGRDGRGWLVNADGAIETVKDTKRAFTENWIDTEFFTENTARGVLIGNVRAEPTTEYVQDKHETDQQPYSAWKWSAVHNGTIANDADLRTGLVDTKIDSAAIVETLESADSFRHGIERLVGSYAIIATDGDPSRLFVAANYRPIWYVETEVGAFFASSRDYFPRYLSPKMLEPYSVGYFTFENDACHKLIESLYKPADDHKALVICSGGLDSTVAATYAKRVLGYRIELLHFLYGSRAQAPEIHAVKAVSKALGAPVTFLEVPTLYKPENSPLLQENSAIAGGEEGAEFAHEWVPARNLVLLAMATAYAEANGFQTIVLGNNLEEAGAYPDNEQEFTARFNDILPFAVGAGKRVKLLTPVANLMKHEIVGLGLHLNAPLDKTWSCYRAGQKHCGKCGPCFMRRTAFEINKTPEVIEYESLG